ncbi:MAG: Crp/Fnr family transcriptional regulator [Chthoniobacteraceae bacterium]
MTPFTPLKEFEAVTSILSKISLFGGVTDAQRNDLLARLDYATFQEGEYVFRAGDEPTHIYIVKQGKVEVRLSADEVEVEKIELSVGACFGAVSLMSMHKHTSSALVTEPCEIVALSRHALIGLQQQHITLFALLMMNVARELARRLVMTDDLFLLYSRKAGKG